MKTMALLLVVFCWPTLGCTEEPGNRKLSEAAKKTAQELREKIQEEIKALDKHPWAGKYYEGDGLSVNVSLSLAPKGGYVYEWHGCLGLYDRNYGTVEEKDGTLRLSFTFEHQREGHLLGIAERLVPIAWGERKYLVPAKEVIGFCNEINEGSEPRKEIHGMSLLRIGDEQKKVTGFPSVPKAFEPYLLSKPIETEIVGVGKPTTTSNGGDVKKVTIKVTLKHGAKAGLLTGMKLHVIKPDDVFDSIELEKVEEQQSVGVFTRYSFKGALGLLSLLDKNPKIGWILSTRAPKNEGKSNDQEGTAKKAVAGQH